MAGLFNCVVDNIPGLSWVTGGGGGGSVQVAGFEVIDLESQGVYLHDLIGYSSRLGERPEQRYYFLLPSKLVSSSVSFEVSDIALKDAILESWRGPEGGHSIDVGPTLVIHRISDKAFRVCNADSASDEQQKGTIVEEPESSGLPELSATEAANSMVLTFQSAGVSETWEKGLLEERERDYLPELLELDERFARALHAALWKGLATKRSSFEEIRNVYYKCGRKQRSPACLIMHLYRTFASIVPQDQMVSCVDAFLEVLRILAADVTTRLLFYSWSITPAFLLKFEVFYRQLLLDEEKTQADKEAAVAAAAAEAAAAAVAAGAEPPATTPASEDGNKISPQQPTAQGIAKFLQDLVYSFTGVGATVDPLLLVALVKYIRLKVNAPEYAVNRGVLLKLYGYSSDAQAQPLGSQACVQWYTALEAGRGKVGHPIKITWRQAQLVLEPTMFCGYFYIDYCVENDDVRRARATCSTLPYRMMERFSAFHVNNGANDEDEEEDYAAHFVSYLEWDSLQRGYEEFEMKNRSNRRVLKLIKEAREKYSVPMCTASHLDLQSMKTPEIKDDFIAQLLEGVEAETDSTLKGLRTVLGHWMRCTKMATGTVEVPRKAQLITLLVLSSWLQSRNAIVEGTPSSPLAKTPGPARHSATAAHAKALIGQVTEGEDVTLILALVAAYMAVVHGKVVHLLYANASDLFRDFKRTSPFFLAMSMSAAMNDFKNGATVVFCLQSDLCAHYRDAASRGQAPLAKTLLLIQDVKTFKVTASPNSIYGKQDDVLTASFKQAMDLVLAAENAATLVLEDVPGEAPQMRAARAASLAKAQAAAAEFSKMKENKPLGYRKEGETLVFVGPNGKPNPAKYSLGLEMARYKLQGTTPSVTSKSYFQSLPHVLDQYEGVFGLESMGQVSEGAEFLAFQMGAWKFHIPSDEFQSSMDISMKAKVEDEIDVEDEAAEAEADEEGPADSEGTATDGKTPARLHAPVPGTFSPAGRPEESAMSQYSTGAMMNALCDRFYAKYPAVAGAEWPSCPEHRKLIDFLENESIHHADGVQDFAISLKLAKAGSYGIGV